MPEKYGMTIDNMNYILEKSKTKKDEIYTARGITYRVVKGFSKYMAYREGVNDS